MTYDCYCDYEPAQFYRAETRRARTAHKCTECKRLIAPGERYEKVFGKWEYVVEFINTCQRCLALREYVEAHVPCFCWAHHSLFEDVRETISHFAHEAPGLAFGAGRLMVAARSAPRFESREVRA